MLILAVLGLIGCSASSTSTPPPVPQRLFVGNGYAVTTANRGLIFNYSAPVTSTSTPLFTLTAGDSTSALESFAQDTTYDYVADCNDHLIRAALRPLASSSVQAFTLTGVGVGPDGLAADSSGNLYAGNDCGDEHLDVWSAPISSSSTVSVSVNDATITNQKRQQIYVDNVNHLLYEANCATTQHIMVYNLPLTSTSTAATTVTVAGVTCADGLTINPLTNQLFLGVTTAAASNIIDVFSLPISSSSTPALTITTSTAAQRFINLAFDRSGNLYASDRGTSAIDVFVPPFTTTSSPAFSLTPTGIDKPWGLEIMQP